MSKPNFFISIDAVNCLLSIEIPESPKDIDLTYDLIELPFWFSFSSDEKTQTLKAYNQIEMYSKDERIATECGSVVMDRESGKAQVRSTQVLGDNMGAFFFTGKKLSDLIQDKGLQALYEGLDPEQAGILLPEKNGELNWKVVSGRERPELMVQTLFGGTTMARPYMDDFWERSELDDMGLDEKIEAAEGGNITAMTELAMLYLSGDEDEQIEPDPEKAVYWFRKAAEAGDANSMFNIGLHYAKGHGVERDFAQAVEWMKKAADAGDDDAPAAIEEYQKLADAYEKAEAGDARAQAVLAEGLMKIGGSLEQAGAGDDYIECVKWAEKAAAQDNPDAIWILALAYEHGRGVEENKEVAVDYYKRGAELGNAACQHSYACYIIRGEIEGDTEYALNLLQHSADQGYALAYRTLGYMYEQGEYVEFDIDKELEYFEKALQADASDAEFVRHVAFQYENGDGSDAINLERAIHWFKVAADMGDMLAIHEYQRLSEEPPAFQESEDDNKPMQPYEFYLTNTKKGDRKERSNRIKVGDKITFQLNSESDRVDAITSLGDVGDISTDSWLTKLVKKGIPYSAEIIEVISYNALENKRQNPTINIRMIIDATKGEIRENFGWSYIPDSIYGDGSFGF